MPARASGRSAELVLALMKDASGDARSVTFSVVTSNNSRIGSGNLLIQNFVSANSASKSWPAVGAVITVFCGYLVTMCQIESHATKVDLPTPWPARTEIRRSPRDTSRITLSCQGSGLAPSTIFTNPTGSST